MYTTHWLHIYFNIHKLICRESQTIAMKDQNFSQTLQQIRTNLKGRMTLENGSMTLSLIQSLTRYGIRGVSPRFFSAEPYSSEHFRLLKILRHFPKERGVSLLKDGRKTFRVPQLQTLHRKAYARVLRNMDRVSSVFQKNRIERGESPAFLGCTGVSYPQKERLMPAEERACI